MAKAVRTKAKAPAKSGKEKGGIPAPAIADLDSIIGQDSVIAYLKRAFERGRLPQAILFDGPSGIGKSAMVYALAKFLLAGGETSGAAYERNARRVAATPMIHPDLKILAPSGAGGQIRIESVREAHETAYQMPIEGARKVLIIDPADRLNAASANSLLKLIEEPPKSLFILMATESVHAILPTIRSRSSRLRLRPAPEDLIAKWLVERRSAPDDHANAAALFSGGCPGRALALLEGQALQDREVLIGEWKFFQENGFISLFRVAANLAAIEQPLSGLISAWAAWLRDCLVAATAPQRPDLLINRDRAGDAADQAARLGPEALGRCVECLLEIQRHARPAMNKPLFLQSLLLRLGPLMKDG